MAADTHSSDMRPSTKEGAIIQAATRAFLRCGYGGASMDAIAQDAGVSKQTIYNNFGSKEALFGAIVRDLCDQLLTPLLTPETESRGLEAALTSLARQYLDLMLAPDSLALYRVLMAEVTRFPELGRVTYEAGPAPAVQSLARFLGEQSDAGEIQVEDPALAAEQFYGMLHGYLQLRALLGVEQAWTREELEHYLGRAVDTFVAAHRRRSPTRPHPTRRTR